MSKQLDFGDYGFIEMKRYGRPNEIYKFKVIERLESNSYVNVPVQSPATEILHNKLVPVLRCIQCGFSQNKVSTFKESDVFSSHAAALDPDTEVSEPGEHQSVSEASQNQPRKDGQDE